MPKPVSATTPVDPRKRGVGGYAEQQPANQREADTPAPADPPEAIGGGAQVKRVEPNTLPDRTSEQATSDARGPSALPFDETGGDLGPS